MKIQLLDLIGPRCIIAEDGQKLYDLVFPSLSRGEDVILNFEGVKGFASPFFNFAIGQLVSSLDISVIRSKLHFLNINEVGKIVVERVLENSSIQTTGVDFRKIVDELLAMQQEEND